MIDSESYILKNEELTRVISQGLADVYLKKPANPIEHFACFLIS